MRVYPEIASFLDAAAGGPGRGAELTRYLQEKAVAAEAARLIFICTHNSRRSQMAQLWAHAAADHFGLSGVHCFSGGTESTAFHPNAVAALRECGFRIDVSLPTENPVYEARYSDEAAPVALFSKRFVDAPNPHHDFCAVMTCSDADENCPLVTGASLRVALTWEDPKSADGSGNEARVYGERAREIGGEIARIFAAARMDQ